MAELDLDIFATADDDSKWVTHSGDPIADINALAATIRSEPPRRDMMVVRVGLRAVWDELVRCNLLNPPRFVAMQWLAFRKPYQERERSSGCLNISAWQRNAERVRLELAREQTCFVNRVTGVIYCSPRLVADVRAALEAACVGKKLRFKVGDRVTVAVGHFTGFRGRITQRAHKDVRPHLTYVVTFEQPCGGYEWAGFNDAELEPWTVPLQARPVSVGALQHPARLYFDRHSLSEACNVCSAKAGEPCVNLLEGNVLLGTHVQAPTRELTR